MNDKLVLTKCDYFSDVHLWPLEKDLNARGWLANFDESEAPLAANLLNSFMYFSADQVRQMFRGAFHSISRTIAARAESVRSASYKWREFTNNLLVVPVSGERPNPSDSGYMFSRMARQVLGIDEEHLLTQEQALDILDREKRPLMLVDDFVGSGQQLEKTWWREFSGESFASALLNGGITDAFYCAVICTEYGKNHIETTCPGVHLAAAHILGPEYSAIHSDESNSVIWSGIPLDERLNFIKTVSARAGIPEDDALGFHDLGLALAFEHCVPDATLPIIYWEEDWQPLKRRV